MLLNIEKEISFLPPEGVYQAVCIEVIETKRKDKAGNIVNCVRVVFDLGFEDEDFVYRAGRTFSEKEMPAFKKLLKSWLGKRVRGKNFDTQTAKGERATLEIVYIENEKYPHPFRHINRILPPIDDPDPTIAPKEEEPTQEQIFESVRRLQRILPESGTNSINNRNSN